VQKISTDSVLSRELTFKTKKNNFSLLKTLSKIGCSAEIFEKTTNDKNES